MLPMDLKGSYYIMLAALITVVIVLYAFSSSPHATNFISDLTVGSNAAMTGINRMIPNDDDFEVFEFNSSKGKERVNLTPGLMKDLNICKHTALNMNKIVYKNYEYRQNILKTLVPPSEQFLADFKNPCWYANYTFPKEFNFLYCTIRQKLPLSSDLELLKHVYAETEGEPVKTLQCLPYFYLVGFSKCGTTALMSYIRQHPEYIHPCKKEPHWWSFYKIFDEKDRDTASLLYYLKCFDDAAQKIKSSPRTFITGDESSTIIWNRPTYVHHKEDRIACETPLLIESIQPGTKYIVAIRNPPDQVYSGFYYICGEKIAMKYLNQQTFHTFVENSLKYWKSCIQNYSTVECLYNKYSDLEAPPCESFITFIHPYIMVSIWLQVIPRERILFVKSEELRENTTDVMRDLYKFLELSPLTNAQLAKVVSNQHINELSIKKPPMLPSTRELLQEFFEPFNLKLAQLLNDDKFLWKDA